MSDKLQFVASVCSSRFDKLKFVGLYLTNNFKTFAPAYAK
jgi:hypothetical protein